MRPPSLLPPHLDPLTSSGAPLWLALVTATMLLCTFLAAAEVVPIANNSAFKSWQVHFQEKGQAEVATWPPADSDRITLDAQLALLARQTWDDAPSGETGTTIGKRLKSLAEITTDFASGEVVLVLLLIGWLVSRRLASPSASATFAVGFLGLALAAADVWLLKLLIGRGRPNELIWRGRTDWQPLALDSNHHSLPSGHGAAAGALAMMLSMRWPILAPLWWLLAFSLAATRVLTSSHWPSDALAGVLIGATAVAIIASMRETRIGARVDSPAGP